MGATAKIAFAWVPFLLIASFAAAQPLPPVQSDYQPRSMDDLQQLVAPVALYPDALLAQVLAACTYPDDVIAAAKWEDAGNDPNSVDSQSWDPSVKGVARLPQVLHYLASNGDWMNDLGDAFLNQQSDVMAAVQNLRAQALAAGTLFTTPQQTVINQDGYIQIIPTNPDDLFAPVYDPNVVYAPPDYSAGQPIVPYITFGPPCLIGDWLDFDCDWYAGGVFFGNWGRDRPWWLDRGHYLDVRPGLHLGGSLAVARWGHAAGRPLPRVVHRAVALPGGARGFQTAARPGDIPRGSEAIRQSERGRASRATIAPAPRPAPRPVPERSAAPPPEVRQSAPVRGGAVRGYEPAESAARSSARGAESRGGGGGGARGGGGGARGGGGRR